MPLIIAGFVSILPVHARLGETEQQLTARYGKGSVPWKESDLTSVHVQMFYKDGVSIKVMLIDGVSVGESYNVAQGLTDTEIGKLLELNAQGHAWKEQPSQEGAKQNPWVPVSKWWKREDGAMAFAKVPYSLTIKSKELLASDDAVKAAEKKAGASFNGF